MEFAFTDVSIVETSAKHVSMTIQKSINGGLKITVLENVAIHANIAGKACHMRRTLVQTVKALLVRQ